MDCRDAQFYLRFRRPGSDELGPEATADLDHHLAECPACGQAARSEAAFDRTIGSAMTAVAIPTGLRNRLVTHVAARRGTALRRKAYRYAGLATAAMVLLGVGIGALNTRVVPNVESLIILNEPQDAEQQEAAVRTWLAQNKLPPQLPENFDYALHVHHGVERVQDRDVPVVVFRDRNGPGFAKVYIFRNDARFKTDELREQIGKTNSRSQCTATVATVSDARGVVYVIVYTGPSLDAFLKPRGLPA
jgi:hypothetical protein